MNARGMRRSRRVACRAKVQLSWIDENGAPCGGLAACTDISQEGMQVVSRAAIPVRTSLQFAIKNSPLQGGGTVRSCSRNGNQFNIGVTFAAQLRVDPATTPIPGIEITEVFVAPGAAGINLTK